MNKISFDQFITSSPATRKAGVMRRFFYRIFGYCPNHGWFHYAKRYRMNTAYINEEANYSYGCKECQKECFEYYDELWKDYYGSRL